MPIRKLVGDGRIDENWSILHHGCGKDQAGTLLLHSQTLEDVVEYDPHHHRTPAVLHKLYDCVVQNYVLNVLEPYQRRSCMMEVQRVTESAGVAYLSVRGCGDRSIKGEPVHDGVLTSRGTFQKGFTVKELKDLCHEHFLCVEIIYGNTKNPTSITAKCRMPHNGGN